MSNPLKELMPAIYEHEGIWQGTYQHVDLAGQIIDQHASQVECVFPNQGDEVYIQRNKFNWDDGREYEVEFAGVMQDQRIWWDTPTFSGFGWQVTPSLFMLELDRKDIENASFTEVIILAPSKQERVRTWHWFQDGRCFKRTLCNERRL